MKRCPECRRDYYDDSLLYCLDDGTPLLEGPASIEPATAILHETAPPNEAVTKHQIHTTGRTRDLTTHLTTEREPRKAWPIFAVISVVVLAVVGGYFWFRSSTAGRKLGAEMAMVRLVTGIPGRPNNVSISKDGKYVAYTVNQDGKSSLWLRQISQNASLQVLPPVEDDFYRGTTFSQSGDLIYYVRGNDKTDTRGALYQIPVLGGVEPKKVLADVQRRISLSPDGKSATFVRTEPNGNSSVIIASLDGTAPERAIGSRSGDEWYVDAIWSPDGKSIAATTGTVIGGSSRGIVAIPQEGGPERMIGKSWSEIDPPEWLPDGSGFLITSADRPGGRFQIYSVSFPDGEVHRITNDPNDYISARATGDGETLVTLLFEGRSKVSTVDVSDPDKSLRVLSTGERDGAEGVATLPDGRIVFTVESVDTRDLWIMNRDGTGQKALTSEPDTMGMSIGSPDGNTIFFVSMRPDRIPKIWRVNTDGSELRQMTAGEDYWPAISPDGQWIAFQSFRGGTGFGTLWKQPVAGGDALQIAKTVSSVPTFSPDGEQLLCLYLDEKLPVPRVKLTIIRADNGEVIKMFDEPRNATQWFWAVDGKSLIYSENKGDVGNIWSQPIAGGPPKQLTRFTSERIHKFAPSADGKTFALARGTSRNEIVLIKNFK